MKNLAQRKDEKYARLAEPVELDQSVFRGSLYTHTVTPEPVPLADMQLPYCTPGAREMRRKIRAAQRQRDKTADAGIPVSKPKKKPASKPEPKPARTRVRREHVREPISRDAIIAELKSRAVKR